MVGETWYYKVAAVDGSNNESPQSAAAAGTRAATALPTVRINVGGAAFTDAAGAAWQADQHFTGGSASNTAYEVAGTTDDPIYYARRWGAFAYNIPVPNGQYTLNLHFADSLYTVAGKRVFDVRIEGTTALSNFDIAARAGGKAKLVKTFTVNVTDGMVTIETIRKIENPLLSGIELIPFGDTTAPAAPPAVAANGAAAGNAVSWSAPGDADVAGYNVYRADAENGGYAKLNGGLVTGTSFLDTTAPAGVAAYYRVTAVDGSLNESVPSATATAVRPGGGDTTPPAVPAGLAAAPAATGVALVGADVGDADLAGYNVYHSAAAGGPWAKLNGSAVTGSAFAHATAPEGQASYYYVTAVDATGNESSPSAVASATAPVVAGGTGLFGRYYADTTLTKNTFSRTDGTINFDWGSGSPNPAVPVDNFSVRWAGRIKAAVTGTYTFTVRASDGVRLWVNGQRIIDRWAASGTTDHVSSEIALTAGQKYDVKLEYFEGTGAASAKLSWRADGLPQAIVPRGYLYLS